MEENDNSKLNKGDISADTSINNEINNKEIGTSTKIKDAAIKYANRIKNETNSFIKKYNDWFSQRYIK